MKLNLYTKKNGRIVCWILVIVDIFLGGIAVFYPLFYAEILHPQLENPPVDFIVRTGVLWLIFAVFQLIAATSKEPEKWFFHRQAPAPFLLNILGIQDPEHPFCSN